MSTTPPTDRKTVSTRRSRKQKNIVECDHCGLYGICRVAGLEEPGSHLIDEVVDRREPVADEQHLIRAETPFCDIFAVKSGSFKTVARLANGAEQIIDFHFPGELIGLEALANGRYAHDVVALEPSSVCRLSFEHIENLGARFGEFQNQLILALSKRTRHDQWVPLLMGAQNAEQRAATFLLSLSARFAEHDLPSQQLKLPMSRHDIANYLGLAVETVSRMFQRFQSLEYLEVHGRHVELRNMEKLRELACLPPPAPPV